MKRPKINEKEVGDCPFLCRQQKLYFLWRNHTAMRDAVIRGTDKIEPFLHYFYYYLSPGKCKGKVFIATSLSLCRGRRTFLTFAQCKIAAPLLNGVTQLFSHSFWNLAKNATVSATEFNSDRDGGKERERQSVWPDLVKFRHFDKNYKPKANFWRFITYLAKCLAYFDKFVTLLG